MNITAISDQHGHLPEIEPCDLLLIAGDICPVDNHSLTYQRDWLCDPFARWLDQVPARTIVGVAGNHDFFFEKVRDPESYLTKLRWTYLQDSGTEIEGKRIWGSPWQPWFYNWAFNLYEPQLQARWDLIPLDTDILIVHGPPRGHGDKTEAGERTGSTFLTETIQRISPELVVCGHIHEDYGMFALDHTTIANVSIMDLDYEPVNDPTMFVI